jgi:hypothetical protein
MVRKNDPKKTLGAANRQLSTVSRNYDLGDKGFLTDTEQQMRGMDSDNVGHLTNAKVSAIVDETLGLREKNGRMKLWLGILGVAVVVLGLSNLGTAFAAAWLAKDTTINESTGQLLVKDSDTPVTVQSTGLTSNLVLEESNSYGCMDREDAAKLWSGLLDGTPSSLTVQDPSQQYADVDPTLQAFSALALSNNGATWNETMACMPVEGGSGDKVCVDFTDSRCDGSDSAGRALEAIDHHTRRKLFHAAGQGQRSLDVDDNGNLVAVTMSFSAAGSIGDADVYGVYLGTAAKYVVFTKQGISTVPTSMITGDIAVSSAVTSAAITGFALTLGATNDYSTSLQLVDGYAYAADYTASSTPADLEQATLDMDAAYNDAKARNTIQLLDGTTTTTTVGDKLNYGAGNLGANGIFGGVNAPLTAGVYTFTTDVLINVDIVFNGEGNSDSIFIIQITKGMTMAANKMVTLIGGAKAENIFWQVEGGVIVGAGSHMEGIFLAKGSVTFVTKSSLNGRIMGQSLCALQMATINEPYIE